MRERFKNKKGFTLAELLIVVAIIAILVAIMIPVFGASRAEAALSKDAANLRSVYSEAVVDAMSDEAAASYAGGNLIINMDEALKKAGIVKFDGGTKAVYLRPEGSTVGAGNAGKIELSHSGTKKTETIVIDLDVRLANAGTQIHDNTTVIEGGAWK